MPDDPPRPGAANVVDPMSGSAQAKPTSWRPLLVALLERLPPPGSEWPIEKRAQWLRAAVEIMALEYGGDPDTIKIWFQVPGDGRVVIREPEDR